MSSLNEEIGKRILGLRKERHMTQEQLIEKLDISIKHCNCVERGIASLSLERLIDLCDIFDTSLDCLIRGNTSDKNSKIPPSLTKIFSDADEKELYFFIYFPRYIFHNVLLFALEFLSRLVYDMVKRSYSLFFTMPLCMCPGAFGSCLRKSNL